MDKKVCESVFFLPFFVIETIVFCRVLVLFGEVMVFIARNVSPKAPDNIYGIPKCSKMTKKK